MASGAIGAVIALAILYHSKRCLIFSATENHDIFEGMEIAVLLLRLEST